jgi:hypothetical protein
VPTALLALDVQRGGIPRGPVNSVKRPNPVLQVRLSEASFSKRTLKQADEHGLSRSHHNFASRCYRCPPGDANKIMEL